jgi:hypothetical protein
MGSFLRGKLPCKMASRLVDAGDCVELIPLCNIRWQFWPLAVVQSGGLVNAVNNLLTPVPIDCCGAECICTVPECRVLLVSKRISWTAYIECVTVCASQQ